MDNFFNVEPRDEVSVLREVDDSLLIQDGSVKIKDQDQGLSFG